MADDVFTFKDSQSDDASSQENKRKRKNACGCKGNNTCDVCGEEDYVDEEESKGKGKRERKSARMTTKRRKLDKGGDSDVELMDPRTAQLARELADQSKRMMELEKELRAAQAEAGREITKSDKLVRDLEAERKSREEAEKKAKDAADAAQAAREFAKVRGVPCALCQHSVNPSFVVTLRCKHSFCAVSDDPEDPVSCFQSYVRKNAFAVRNAGVLPGKIEITELEITCPVCKKGSGVSFTEGAKHLTFPAPDLVTATGYPYVKPKVVCKCAVRGLTPDRIMQHTIFCPAVPFPCPFSTHSDEKRRCDMDISLRSASDDPARAIRQHFEEKCKHVIICPHTDEPIKLCRTREHFERLRERLDMAAIVQYEMAEFMPADLVPNASHLANHTAFCVGDYNPEFYGKTWEEIMDLVLRPAQGKAQPYFKPFEMRRYFPHRLKDYFSDRALADPSPDAVVAMNRPEQPDSDDEFADVKEAPAPAPAGDAPMAQAPAAAPAQAPAPAPAGDAPMPQAPAQGDLPPPFVNVQFGPPPA